MKQLKRIFDNGLDLIVSDEKAKEFHSKIAAKNQQLAVRAFRGLIAFLSIDKRNEAPEP